MATASSQTAPPAQIVSVKPDSELAGVGFDLLIGLNNPTDTTRSYTVSLDPNQATPGKSVTSVVYAFSGADVVFHIDAGITQDTVFAGLVTDNADNTVQTGFNKTVSLQAPAATGASSGAPLTEQPATASVDYPTVFVATALVASAALWYLVIRK